jgi:hypothetical protein
MQSKPNSDAVQPIAPAKPTHVSTLEQKTQAYPVVAVIDAETFNAAADNLRDLKTLQREVETVEKSATRPLNEALKTVRSWFKPMRERLIAAEHAQRKSMGTWKQRQDELAREAARKAEAEARARREKLEAEARATEEKSRREAEEKRQQAEEAERQGRIAEAAKLQAAAARTEEKGIARADTLMDRADSTVAAPTAVAPPKVEGLSNREVWKFEIRDATKINPGFLMADEKKIAKTVKALKKDAPGVIGEGVRVWSEADFSARRR